MFTTNIELRKRFCKDNNIPIKLFVSPYFEDRFELYNRYYNFEDSLKSFTETYKTVGDEQKYFELYNKVKDDIINFLNSSPEMLFFSQKEDMNKFKITHNNLSKNSIYKPTNSGHKFISLDMKSANFTSLRHYNPNIVKNKDTYEDFVKEFTDTEYFAKSKYIRQVVFGNVNPSRQITYEKYLMDLVLTELEKFIPIESVVSFMNDEIVFNIDNYNENDLNTLIKNIKNLISNFEKDNINLRFEIFELSEILNTSGYVKKMLPESDKQGYVFKGLDSIEMPFVLRKYFNEDIKDTDMVFLYEGKLAKLLEPIDITL